MLATGPAKPPSAKTALRGADAGQAAEQTELDASEGEAAGR